MDLLVSLLGALLATWTGAVMVESPRIHVKKTAFFGMSAYLLFYILNQKASMPEAAIYLICSFYVSFLSQIFARLFKTPVTVFIIPPLFLFVPGSSIYHTVFYFLNGDMNLSKTYLLQSIFISGAIILGIFLSDSLVDFYMAIQYYRNKYRS